VSNKSAEQRFFEKTLLVGECILFTGSLDRDGYGRFWDGRKLIGAHQFTAKIFLGTDGRIDNKEITTLCRHRNCVNPGHFEIVKHRVVVERGEADAADNMKKIMCPMGHYYDVREGRRRRCSVCRKAINLRAVKKYQEKK